MEKRGQVTAFIIIGLVILIIVGGIIVVRQGYLNVALEKIGLVKLKPTEVKPIESFIGSCVEQIAKEGINLVALQGGYINLPRDTMPTSPFTPLQANLEIISGSDLKAPLWFRERGNGVQETNVPSQTDIENELAGFINERFALCVNNLTSFSDQGYEFSGNSVPKTKTSISKNKVNAEISYPIKVSKDGTEYSINSHSATVDSRLGDLYSAAKEIMNSENKNTFLENRTLSALVAYDSEVPYAGIDLECGEKIWFKPDVILKLKNILYENTAAITVKNSNSNTNDDLKYLQFDALESSRKDVTVNFMYIPDWPTVVEINPSEGNVLRNNPIGKNSGAGVQAIVSSFVCIGDHRFVYDIKYPVLITLRDPSGLIFQFATQVIINRNMPRINRQEMLDLPQIDNTICQYPQKEVAIVTGTLDENGELIPLSDVDLSFKCSPAICDLGTSKKNNKGTPVLIAKVPLCFNGIVEGRKGGYYRGKALYSSNQETNNEVLLTLEPKYKKKVKVYIIEKETGEIREPYDTEQISFQFTNNLGYSINYNYPGNEEVELLVGDYKINSYVIRNSTWSITTEKKEIETCVDTRASGLMGFFKTETKCQTMKIDPIELNYVMTGGAKFDYTFERQDLANTEILNLYVPSDPIPSDLDGMNQIQMSLDTNSENKFFKYPEVSA